MAHYEVEQRRRTGKQVGEGTYWLVRVETADGVKRPKPVAKLIPLDEDEFQTFTRLLSGVAFRLAGETVTGQACGGVAGEVVEVPNASA